MHPCLTPVSTPKSSVTWLLLMTLQSRFSYWARTMFTNFRGIPWCRRIFQSDGRCRLSKAFTKCTNTTQNDLFHSCDCSKIWGRKAMWSMYDFPFLKTTCSWRSSLSTAVVIRWKIMRQKTLLLVGSCVMPLHLVHLDKFPFLGSWMTVPLLQASGITSLSQTSMSTR